MLLVALLLVFQVVVGRCPERGRCERDDEHNARTVGLFPPEDSKRGGQWGGEYDFQRDSGARRVNKLWVVDGMSWKENGVNKAVPFTMGSISVAKNSTSNDFYGLDDICDEESGVSSFEMTYAMGTMSIKLSLERATSSSLEWRVSESLMVEDRNNANPEEAVAASLLHLNFFKKNTVITLRVKMVPSLYGYITHNHVVMTSTTDSTTYEVTLVGSHSRLPFSRFHELTGIWRLYSPNSNVRLTLEIKPRRRYEFSGTLKGYNYHQFDFHKTNENGEIEMGMMVSSNMTATGDTELELSTARRISIADRILLSTSELPQLTFSSKDGVVIFQRPPKPVITTPSSVYGISSYWSHKKEMMVVSENVSETLQNAIAVIVNSDVSVVAEVQETDFAVLYEIYVNGMKVLRHSTVPSAHELIHVVTPLDEGGEPSDISLALRFVLEEVETFELYDDKSYLTLVGPHVSLSFRHIMIPTPGLWVLDHRFSEVDGDISNLLSKQGRRGTLEVSNDGDVTRGAIKIGSTRFEFIINIDLVRYGLTDFDISQVSYIGGEDEMMELLRNFLCKPFPVLSMVQGNKVEGLSMMKEEGQIIFLHPKDLSGALEGSWRLREFSDGANSTDLVPVYLELVSSGVGRLDGKLFIDSMAYRVEMVEVLRAVNGLGRLPESKFEAAIISWDMSVRSDQMWNRHVQTPLNSAIAQELDKPVEIRTTNSQLIIQREGGRVATFVPSVSHKVRHNIVGTWLVEFIVSGKSLVSLNDAMLGRVEADNQIVSFTVEDLPESKFDEFGHRLEYRAFLRTLFDPVPFANTTFLVDSNNKLEIKNYSSAKETLLDKFFADDDAKIIEVNRHEFTLADSSTVAVFTKLRHRDSRSPRYDDLYSFSRDDARNKKMKVVKRRLESASMLNEYHNSNEQQQSRRRSIRTPENQIYEERLPFSRELKDTAEENHGRRSDKSEIHQNRVSREKLIQKELGGDEKIRESLDELLSNARLGSDYIFKDQRTRDLFEEARESWRATKEGRPAPFNKRDDEEKRPRNRERHSRGEPPMVTSFASEAAVPDFE